MALSKIKAGSLAVDAVTSAAIADGAIVIADLADGSITSPKLATSIDITGDFTVDTTRLVVDSTSDRVGIGTASPDTDINIKLKGSSASNKLFIESAGSSNYGLYLASFYSENMAYIGATNSGNGDFNGASIGFIDYGRAIQFRTNVGASLSEAARIDSSGRLGIGTTSPSSKLHLQGSTGGYLELFMEPSADTDVATVAFRSAANSVTKGYVLYDYTNNYMGFRTNGSGEAMRIASNGDVYIGDSSPGFYPGKLDVTGTITARVASSGLNTNFNVRDADEDDLFSIYTDGTTGEARLRSHSDSPTSPFMTFYTGSSEAARIDSSGNFLVGKTSTDGGTNDGLEVRSNGIAFLTRDGGTVAELNRRTSDGIVIDVRKDSTIAGGIYVGTASSSPRIQIGRGASGLWFRDDLYNILPRNVGNNTVSDGLLDLGNVSNRFKDLYLSGDLEMSVTTGAGSNAIRMTRTDTTVSANNTIGNWFFEAGEDGSEEVVAQISAAAQSDFTSTSSPTYLQFKTTASGNTSATEVMRIQSDGEVIIGDTNSANSKLFVGGGSNTGDNGLAIANANETCGKKILCLSPPSIPNGGSISMVFSGFGGDSPYSIKFRFGGFSGAIAQPGAHQGFSVEYCFNGTGNMSSVLETFEYGVKFNSGDVSVSGSGGNLTLTIQHHGAHSASINYQNWMVAEVYGYGAHKVYLSSQS